jgi:hypothetical protein
MRAEFDYRIAWLNELGKGLHDLMLSPSAMIPVGLMSKDIEPNLLLRHPLVPNMNVER